MVNPGDVPLLSDLATVAAASPMLTSAIRDFTGRRKRNRKRARSPVPSDAMKDIRKFSVPRRQKRAGMRSGRSLIHIKSDPVHSMRRLLCAGPHVGGWKIVKSKSVGAEIR